MEFYYSFSLDYKKNSFNIGIDESSSVFTFVDCVNFKPVVKKENYGYSVTIKDIYMGIDINYELTKSDYSIINNIKLKENQAYLPRNYSIKIE